MAIDSRGLRFGMVQGRLIQSPPGQLQWFPQEFWESEFLLAGALGLDFIELIAERHHNAENPIWSNDGHSRIRAISQRAGLSIHAFCNDFIVDHALVGDDTVLDQNLRLIERGSLLGCEKYVLPLFEHSEMTSLNMEDFIEPLRVIADCAAAAGITVCLETVLNGLELVRFLDRLDRPAARVVFDTGNRIAFGHDLATDIRMLGDRIAHVHIKDKNAANQNVILGTGLVNFLTVFEALHDIAYAGPYTFETQRGRSPIRTAAHNIALVKFFHAESIQDA